MKGSLQKVLLLAVVVLLVGGLTFMRNWTQTVDSTGPEVDLIPKDQKSAPVQVKEATVFFPVLAAEGTLATDYMVNNHYDFWFENANDYDVDVGVEKKSCKCSRVEVLNLTPEEERSLRGPMYQTASADLLAGSSGLLSYLSMIGAGQLRVYPFLAQGERWKHLVTGDEKGLPVPKRSTAFMRLHWDGRNLGPIRLGLKLWVQKSGEPQTKGGETQLEVPINVVRSLEVYPEALNAYEVDSSRSSITLVCFCWSQTRAMFHLGALVEDDPAFECSATELTGEEFRATAKQLGKDKDPPVQPVTIYRVLVSVRDRGPGGQLDWGPFNRDLVLKPDKPEMDTLKVLISGTVRGPVTVGTPDAPDRIELRPFPASEGTKVTIPIASNQTGLDVAVESQYPAYVEASLKKVTENDGSVHWDLTVSVPPNQPPGKMPIGSSVVLKTLGPNPHRIRIPIFGKATMSSSGS
jgi:hypothetical protein